MVHIMLYAPSWKWGEVVHAYSVLCSASPSPFASTAFAALSRLRRTEDANEEMSVGESARAHSGVGASDEDVEDVGDVEER